MNVPFNSATRWLTPRRIRAQAVILALCLWGVCAVDFATPGLFDRAGNIKFQDFLQFYISARQIAQGRTSQLFDEQIAFDEMRAIVYGNPNAATRVRLPTVYGPQVGLLFVPLAHLSFAAAARTWALLSVIGYFTCVYLIWRACPNLRPHAGIIAIATLAFPPFFHFFVRGQISVLLLACFTAALLAFHAQRPWLAGFALGLLAFKPQFLIAIPLVLLFARAWRPLAATILSATAQLVFTWIYFGSSVMRAYFETLLHMSRWMSLAEPGLAQIQMHSLRSFWTLLIPWPNPAFILYLLSSVAIVAITATVWRSSAALPLRFSALTLAALLVNPHLFIYDLLVLAPALLLLIDWIVSSTSVAVQFEFKSQNLFGVIPNGAAFQAKRGISRSSSSSRELKCTTASTSIDWILFRSRSRLSLLLYLSFILPLFGPLARWTHLQFSVLAFAALLWVIWRCSRTAGTTLGHKLAPNQSRDV